MNFDWIEVGELAASAIPVGMKDLQALYEQGIRAIVSLTEHPLTAQAELTEEQIDNLGMVYLHVAVVDQQPPAEEDVGKVRHFIRQMRAQARPVLVHCHAGSGRTGTLLHAYYLANGESLQTVKSRIKAKRPVSQFFMLSAAQQAFLEAYAAQIEREA